MKKKIRTEENLEDALSDDYSWRLLEINAMKSLVRRASDRKSGLSLTALIRGGVALLYAHWEGLVKAISHDYLEFVVSQNLKYDELEINFVALGCKNQIHNAIESRKIQAHIDVSKFFINNLAERCQITIDKAIDTESNLSSLVLKEIINCLGLDYSPFESKANLIDESLLFNRNCIAHGENLTIDVQQYLDLCDEVLGMMNIFKNQISNNASMKLYKRQCQKETK